MGDIFKVEKVLRKRDFNGRTQYLIKWAHFPDSANTWEPECNVLPFIKQSTIDRDISDEHQRRKDEVQPSVPLEPSKGIDIDRKDNAAKSKRFRKKYWYIRLSNVVGVEPYMNKI